MLAVVVAVEVIACAGKVQIVTAPVEVLTCVPVPAVILLTYPPATEFAVTAVVTQVLVLKLYAYAALVDVVAFTALATNVPVLKL